MAIQPFSMYHGMRVDVLPDRAEQMETQFVAWQMIPVRKRRAVSRY
jgi:hypothetical protein